MADVAGGLTVGPYRVERELGRGAFGVVYRAAHRDTPDSPVALKVVDARGSVERAMLEPALLAKLDHPCVVRVLDYFPHDTDKLAIAMEYVGGGDLQTAIDDANRFSPAVVRDLLVQLAGALAEAHGKGVVHRDLKPANVLVDRTADRPRYVLTDFGVGGEGAGLRAEKKLAGTYLFMAPEQLRGRPGPQSDLWALGVVAYRMLTGRFPFPGPGLVELSRQIQLTTPPPPSVVTGEKLDADLERAVMRLLDRSESERLGSATDLLAALGYDGETKNVLASRDTVRPVAQRDSLDETLSRGIRKNYRQMAAWAVLFLLFRGPVGGSMTLGGFVLFYRAHLRLRGRRKVLAFVAAFSLVGLSWWLGRAADAEFTAIVSGTTKAVAVRTFPVLFVILTTFSVILFAMSPFVFPVMACGAYARANRLRRERTLLRAAAAGVASDEYLALLGRELEYRYEDVGFHLKYAEALAARGDDRAAAVEARLLLLQDPYHFGGNLLLAQCYARLGLHAECERVASAYLAVTGYSFEFEDLRQQAAKTMGA